MMKTNYLSTKYSRL